MYNVVFEIIKAGSRSYGKRTWRTFKNKKAFNEWYDSEQRSFYRVLQAGVASQKQARIQCDERDSNPWEIG